MLDWQPVESWPAFASSVFTAAQAHTDTLQSTLPGYRERIVEVRLKQSEGGLNLNMDPATIQVLFDRGDRAGKALREQFQFDQHRWVRFLTLLSELERNLDNAAKVYQELGFEDLIRQAPGDEEEFPYSKLPAGWSDRVIAAVNRMGGVIAQTADADGGPLAVPDNFPTPMPQLRMTTRDLVLDPEEGP